MNEDLKEYILDNIKHQYTDVDESLIKEYMFICDNSQDKYPVNIDILVKLKFYSVKRDAKKRLVGEFILNVDYIP
jgi:hypothetical protein